MPGPIVLAPAPATVPGWFPARDAIAAILLGVSITDPITDNIKLVYAYRDHGEADFPCVVMPNPPGKRVERGPSGYRSKVYVVEMQLLVQDADGDRQANILDAFEEAIIDAFDNAITLGLFAGYSVVSGPEWEPGGTTTVKDSSTAGIAVGRLTIKMLDGKNFIG